MFSLAMAFCSVWLVPGCAIFFLALRATPRCPALNIQGDPRPSLGWPVSPSALQSGRSGRYSRPPATAGNRAERTSSGPSPAPGRAPGRAETCADRSLILRTQRG